MGLYLCIFDDDGEVDGVEVGRYEDFGRFRDAIRTHLEAGIAGRRFPTLMLHHDSDGEWSPTEAKALVDELAMISDELSKLPPDPIDTGWKQSVAQRLGLKPATLRDCFFDVDGEPLVERLVSLCQRSIDQNLAILFQ